MSLLPRLLPRLLPAPSRTLAAATNTHDNGFNAVRLVCSLMVVVYHAYLLNPAAPGRRDPLSAALQPVTDAGGLAVGVFFLLSGMFVSQSWLRDPDPWRFALRRVMRIVPGLFVALLITTIPAVAFFSERGFAGLLDPAPWRYIFGNSVLHFLQYNIPPQELFIPWVLGGQGLNGSLWTLYWEGRMYVLLLLLGVAAVLPMRQWLCAASIFLLLAANLIPEVLSGYLWEVRLWSLFLTGILLQTLAAQVRIGPVHVLCAVVLALLNWTRSAAMTPHPLTWFGIALVACTLALWIGGARVRGLGHVQRHDYSYAIYIYHWPVLLMVAKLLPTATPGVMLGCTLLVVLPLAMLSWHFVEAPAMRAARRWLRRPASSAPAPVTEQSAV
jgi:peptidoglycan/LPS O-acetylase OafA/YrhL